jgi:hypothetical protein
MSWRETSGNYKARWTGYRRDRRAGRRQPALPPQGIQPTLSEHKRDIREMSGQWVSFGAPVNTAEQACVHVSDDEAKMGVRSTHGTPSEWHGMNDAALFLLNLVAMRLQRCIFGNFSL